MQFPFVWNHNLCLTVRNCIIVANAADIGKDLAVSEKQDYKLLLTNQ